MQQADQELANSAESLWCKNPFLRPTAGKYSLRRAGEKWSWSHGVFSVDVSPCEAEEAIAGKMLAALGRMWSEIKIEQHTYGKKILFVVSCRGEDLSTCGSGSSAAVALIDAWITDAD